MPACGLAHAHMLANVHAHTDTGILDIFNCYSFATHSTWAYHPLIQENSTQSHWLIHILSILVTYYFCL